MKKGNYLTFRGTRTIRETREAIDRCAKSEIEARGPSANAKEKVAKGKSVTLNL
jgi:hypothetical protein